MPDLISYGSSCIISISFVVGLILVSNIVSQLLIPLVFLLPVSACATINAATAFNQGWGRKDVSEYLFEKARMPAGEFRKQFELLAWADWMKSLSDREMVPMTQDVENIKVIVSGGAGKHSCVVPSWGMTRSVTLPIEI